MSQCSFIVSLTPREAMDRVKVEQRSQRASKVYEEFHDIGDGKFSGTVIFEKYYMRNSNRAALAVLVNNFQGRTQVTAVATGSSEGMIFNFDWGAADEFAESVKKALKGYIIE